MLLPRLQGNKHAITSNLSLHYRDVRMVDSLVSTACHDQPGPFLPDTCISRIHAGCKLHQGATCSQSCSRWVHSMRDLASASLQDGGLHFTSAMS